MTHQHIQTNSRQSQVVQHFCFSWCFFVAAFRARSSFPPFFSSCFPLLPRNVTNLFNPRLQTGDQLLSCKRSSQQTTNSPPAWFVQRRTRPRAKKYVCLCKFIVSSVCLKTIISPRGNFSTQPPSESGGVALWRYPLRGLLRTPQLSRVGVDAKICKNMCKQSWMNYIDSAYVRK